jgi:hypothetical protein
MQVHFKGLWVVRLLQIKSGHAQVALGVRAIPILNKVASTTAEGTT